MVVALLVHVKLVGASGWLYSTDTFWGVEWVGETHDALAILLLVLVGLHVAGVVFTSVAHRENLVAAMVHGRKRAPQEGEVD
jgi:cytochrome b